MEKNNKNAARVAIVIPVYNDEQHLVNCIESILQQTAEYWEAVFVDDASTDNSVQIIERYERAEPKIRLFKNSANSSAWVARAKGILNISDSVQYILFADADDTLQPDMVESAYKAMLERPVDILHFGTNVICNGRADKKAIEKYSQYLQPPVAFLSGRKIFDSFVERSFEGHLWNKMFDAHLLQDTVNRIGPDRVLPKAQDKALYWAVCWSKPDLTYRGIATRLYNYNYGAGVEGNDSQLALADYKQYLCQAWTENVIAEIMRAHPEAAEYGAVLEKSRYNLLRHSIRNLMRLPFHDRSAGLDMALSYWNDAMDPARIACALAEFTWGNRMDAAEMVKGSSLNRITAPDAGIKTVGTYYHRMDNGGIQRVIVNVVEMWRRLGYNVVLFTDCDPSENDYELPAYVKRVKIALPSSKCRNTDYVERGMSLAKLIKENGVDCMVYHSYFSDVLLYDICVCKGLNVPFVLYVHNVFTKFLFELEAKFSTVARAAELADAVVCLSETDKCWWGNFNDNVHSVLNPLSFKLDPETVAERDNHNILFLCRMVEFPKRPGDAITIAKKVIAKIPDAKLYMVGSTDNKRYMDRLQNRINKLQLENNIVLCGFHKDVEEFYQSCSVFLSCSAFEGFPLTLCEAMSYGLPVVMYELPYLETAKNNEGIISVKQCDTDAAVDAIVGLFSDREKLIATGNKGKEFLENMYRQDLVAQWKDVFGTLFAPRSAEDNAQNRIIAKMLIEDYYAGVASRNKDMDAASSINKRQDELIKQCRSQLDLLKAGLGDLEKILGSGGSAASSLTKNEITAVNANLSKVVSALEETNRETTKLRKEKAAINGDLQAILNSRSYKIGRLITYFPRKIRDFFKRQKK